MEIETLRELDPSELEKNVKTKRVATQKQLDALAASRAKRAQMKKEVAQAAAPVPPSEPKPIKKAKKPIVIIKYGKEMNSDNDSSSDSDSSSDDEPPMVVLKKPKLVRQAPVPVPIPVAPPVQQIFIRRAR